MARVSGFQFRNLEARRLSKSEPRPTQVRIDNNLQVTVVKSTGPETCQIEFSYTATYGALGFIKIEGELTYAGPLAAEASRMWEEKRQMPGEAAGEVHTGIMHACIPEAVTLARSVQLPPPIPLPTVKFQPPAAPGAKGVGVPANASANPEFG